ncbi:hypothetical protein SAMN04488499_107721 [Sporomusa acidovorans]|nr:hypothetical protein SPACI_28360 [Sporomusa acidovorans DSM 3132]SDF75490.1 hypothetical protein SAMN04488499_107721 [Sporomusa acidovorans]
MDTCFWCPRGGTGAAAAGNERLLPPGQASGGRWPGGAFFRFRRPSGRPAGSASGLAAGPAGVSCRGPAQRAGPAAVVPFPRQPGGKRTEVFCLPRLDRQQQVCAFLRAICRNWLSLPLPLFLYTGNPNEEEHINIPVDCPGRLKHSSSFLAVIVPLLNNIVVNSNNQLILIYHRNTLIAANRIQHILFAATLMHYSLNNCLEKDEIKPLTREMQFYSTQKAPYIIPFVL